ncbi:unnamed protein product [Euphydryas editha]|uniref:Uncharacterized protein n=1 Tax=Euphydryas editha TaxID=104508 RepID=A0AAU9UYQ3_EUPED|nr:unnamed protein product [Euphydryas editha]
MSKKHLHNQAAIPLAPAVFKKRRAGDGESLRQRRAELRSTLRQWKFPLSCSPPSRTHRPLPTDNTHTQSNKRSTTAPATLTYSTERLDSGFH